MLTDLVGRKRGVVVIVAIAREPEVDREYLRGKIRSKSVSWPK